MIKTDEIKIAVYAGSFDPITLGHLDILKDGAKLFDKVILAVANNSDKKCIFSVEDRLRLISKTIEGLSNVEVDSFDGLTVEYAKKKGAKILLRGIRNVSDFEYEMQLSHNNRALAPDIKTVFLPTSPEHSFISSSAVREILSNGGNISGFVPENIIDILKKSYK